MDGITTVQSLTPRSPWGHIQTIDDDPMPPKRKLPGVAIECIGPHFMDGVMDGIIRNGLYANKRGYEIQIEVIHDISIHPNEGVNMMRNWACMAALNSGAEYLFMVDNDYLLDDPTTLYTLLNEGKHMVIPWVDQSLIYPSEEAAEGATRRHIERLGYPLVYPDQGLVPLEWHSINCILIDTLVFRLVGTQLFTGPLITNHEDYIFLNLRNHGVKLWQQTNAKVKVLRPATKVWKELGEENPNPSSPEHRAKIAAIVKNIDETWNRLSAEME